MNEKKEFYLIIKGEKVMVSEEVYRAYIRPLRVERLRKLRAWKCKVKGKKGNLVRCQEDCSKCPYALAGKNATGNTLSLDEFKEAGVEILDRNVDLETAYIENEEWTSNQERLHKAILQLTPRQQEMVQMIYYEGKTEQEIANKYGITQQAVHNALKKILSRLKNIF